MTSTLKVDQIQLVNGNAPTAADLGFAAGSVIQIHYAKLSTAVSASASSYDVITTNFTPKSSNSTLLIETQVFMGGTQIGNLDGGIILLRDGTRVETGADADGPRGGNDVLDSMDDLWNADNRSQWYREKMGGVITTPANSTSQSTFIVRFNTNATRNIYVNRPITGTAQRGISYLTITEIAG